MDRAEALEPLATAMRPMAVLLVVLVTGVVVAALLVSRALVTPLEKLRLAAERISRGDLDVRVGIASHDEIGELATSFERMVTAIRFFRAHVRRPEEDEETVDEASV